ncbi:MAG: hypothetical protein B7Y45_13265 [Sphingomonas sp. 28-66-16]|nr:MAG: hypothetical protein B7Y45_13265 [Sphingomonas sp. 28-66-16]
MTIFTIGYEGTTMADFLATLKAAGVRQVIDVRMLPLSRRPGFSKTPLAASLAEEGIGYVHLKALGTPKPGRDAARKGDLATLRAVYAGQLELPEAQAAAARLRDLAAETPSAVMCFCGNAAKCHRRLLLDAEGANAEVIDLAV